MIDKSQVIVDAGALRRGIALASSAMQHRGNIPILGAVKVTANGAFVMESTNLDNHAMVRLGADDFQASANHEELRFALPRPDHLREALRHSGAAQVGMARQEGGKGNVRFEAGRLTADLGTLPADDFPDFDVIHFLDFAATFGASELRQLARVLPAMSTEETRYYLNGVCVTKVSEWLWRFAATDGHRLMVVDIPLPDTVGAIPDGTIIPAEWIRLALRHFAKTKKGTRMTFGNTLARNHEAGIELPIDKPGGPRISIEGDLEGLDFALTGKLIDGSYPDYAKIVPKGYVRAARLQLAELVQAVRALSGFATEKTRAVKMVFEAGGSVAISLNSVDLGEGSFRIPAQHNLEHGFKIGLNGRYLIETCAAFNGDEIELNFDKGESASGAPILFRDPSDTGFLAVLMPMRV